MSAIRTLRGLKASQFVIPFIGGRFSDLPHHRSLRLSKSVKSTLVTMDSPTNSQKTVSDDEEIDYSIKPELYDSDLDDKDELWMVKKRDGRTSDAVLSCPACFTTVCYECQRHEQYVTQYRAVFVVNCKVDKVRVLQPNATSSKVGKRMRDSETQETGSTDEERLNPVFCSTCSTEIGAIDIEEIYHFFNAIPSEP